MKDTPNDPFYVLSEVAGQQQGLFTSKQAEEAGYVSSHHSYHVKAGNWIREMRGIYRLPHFPQNEEDAQLVLWYLWSRNRNEEPQGVYSHDTALKIYELSDLMPSKLHMTVPKSFRRYNEPPKILELHKENLQKSVIRFIRGFAVTTPTRTLLDLIHAGYLDGDILAQATKEAFQRGLVNPKDERKIKRALEDNYDIEV